MGADLGPEAAADIGGDDPDLVAFDAVAGGEGIAHAVRVLGGDPEVQPAAVVPRGRRRASLEGHAGDPLVDEALDHDDLAVVEDRVVAAEVELDGEVGAGVGVQQDVVARPPSPGRRRTGSGS